MGMVTFRVFLAVAALALLTAAAAVVHVAAGLAVAGVSLLVIEHRLDGDGDSR